MGEKKQPVFNLWLLLNNFPHATEEKRKKAENFMVTGRTKMEAQLQLSLLLPLQLQIRGIRAGGMRQVDEIELEGFFPGLDFKWIQKRTLEV